MRLFILSLLILNTITSYCQNETGKINGIVSDIETGELLPFVNVVLKTMDNNIIQGTTSNYEGEYKIDNLKIGEYVVEISYVGYFTQNLNEVKIFDNSKVQLDADLKKGVIICSYPHVYYYPNLFSLDNLGTSTTFNRNDIIRSTY